MTSKTIKEIAEQLGTTQRAIRWYQEKGLVAPIRGETRNVLYDEMAVKRLSVVIRLAAIGFSLAEIKNLLANWQPGKTLKLTPRQIESQRQYLINQHESANRSLAVLETMLDELDRDAGSYKNGC